MLRAAFAGAERVHLIGLVSDGGVHSGFEHLEALIRLGGAARGRRTWCCTPSPTGATRCRTSGAGYLETVEGWMRDAGAGRVGSVVGRYYAMDRDKRWDRIQLAYDLLVHGRAEHHAGDAAPRRRAAPTSATRPTSSSSRCWSATRPGSGPATR